MNRHVRTRAVSTIGGLIATLSFVVSCVAPAPVPLDPASPKSDLRVMTFNILGAQGDDSVFSEQRGWAARIDQIRPDVVVLQEAQASDVGAIVSMSRVGYRKVAYKPWVCDQKLEPEGVAILVRDGVEVSGGGGTNVGGSCVNPSLKRVLVWADIELVSGPVRVYGTHLTQGGVDYDASRNNQIRLIRETIAAHDAEGTNRWILAGDMNTRPGDESYGRIVGDGDAESFAMVDSAGIERPNAIDPATCGGVPASDAAGISYLTEHPEVAQDCGYTGGWPKDSNFLGCDVLSLCESWNLRRDQSVRERLDYIFWSDHAPFVVANSFVPSPLDADWDAAGSEWFRISDHLPYVVDIAVTS